MNEIAFGAGASLVNWHVTDFALDLHIFFVSKKVDVVMGVRMLRMLCTYSRSFFLWQQGFVPSLSEKAPDE